ncbi:MAG: acylphosphatase, partial [Burkholderiales bacterium]
MKVSKHLHIHGRVQGVYFRESMRERAEQLGVTGWVRNCLDGSVEATIHGEQYAVALLIEWARHGSSQAKVERVDVSHSEEIFTHFE